MKYTDMMALQSWWMAKLRNLIEKVKKEEEKRQERAKRGVDKQLGNAQ